MRKGKRREGRNNGRSDVDNLQCDLAVAVHTIKSSNHSSVTAKVKESRTRQDDC